LILRSLLRRLKIKLRKRKFDNSYKCAVLMSFSFTPSARHRRMAGIAVDGLKLIDRGEPQPYNVLRNTIVKKKTERACRIEFTQD